MMRVSMRVIAVGVVILGLAQTAPTLGADPATAYQGRLKAVCDRPGLAAFWDFVQREDGINGSGRFLAHVAPGDTHRYLLEPRNISRDFWQEGAEATMADFPLLGRGPFGQAVEFHSPRDLSDLPVLALPRSALQDTPLDVKGPGQSVSMVVWMIYQSGDHAIAGIWHEGTDSPPKGIPAVLRVGGQRQYGLFAGLGANPGGLSPHVSENGLASFGDVYARHMATSPEKLKKVAQPSSPETLDAAWTSVGMVYDNARKTVTAYVDGVASEYWVDEPAKNPFYKHAERAWRQGRTPASGTHLAQEPVVTPDQYYHPPETTLLSELLIRETEQQRVVLRTFEFTKVRVTFGPDEQGRLTRLMGEELAALKVNPYYFGHDIYGPATGGGPFTIGRVIHSNRHATFSGYIGGVAVYTRPLSAGEMKTLSEIGRREPTGVPEVLEFKPLTARKF